MRINFPNCREAYDFRMAEQPLCHDLGSAELVSSNQDVDVGSILSEIYRIEELLSIFIYNEHARVARTSCFFSSRVTATNDGQRFVPKYQNINIKLCATMLQGLRYDEPEDRHCTVTDSASTDSTLPVDVFALEVQTFRARTSCNNDGIGCFWFLALFTLAPILERSFREVDFCDGLCDDVCPEA